MVEQYPLLWDTVKKDLTEFPGLGLTSDVEHIERNTWVNTIAWLYTGKIAYAVEQVRSCPPAQIADTVEILMDTFSWSAKWELRGLGGEVIKIMQEFYLVGKISLVEFTKLGSHLEDEHQERKEDVFKSLVDHILFRGWNAFIVDHPGFEHDLHEHPDIATQLMRHVVDSASVTGSTG